MSKPIYPHFRSASYHHPFIPQSRWWFESEVGEKLGPMAVLSAVKCCHPTNHYRITIPMIILLKSHYNPIKSHKVTINPKDGLNVP